MATRGMPHGCRDFLRFSIGSFTRAVSLLLTAIAYSLLAVGGLLDRVARSLGMRTSPPPDSSHSAAITLGSTKNRASRRSAPTPSWTWLSPHSSSLVCPNEPQRNGLRRC